MVKRIWITIGLALTGVSSGMTQWNNGLNENTEVLPFTGLPTLASDGENGVIVFSQSRDVNPLLRAQRIDVKGNSRSPGLQGVSMPPANGFLAMMA